MKAHSVILSILLAGTIGISAETEKGIKDLFDGQFYMGAAVSSRQIARPDPVKDQLLQKHFNSIVAENCMKCAFIHPQKDHYSFKDADAFVELGLKNKNFIIGHALIWHEALPNWFYKNADGTFLSKDELLENMRQHIHTVVTRYKGKVNGWDVVNEAIMEDGSWRKTPFYQILGEDFIKYAFQFAHEADPDVELYYNDFNMTANGKRAAVVKLIQRLKKEGLRIDAVGMQSHISMGYPSLDEIEKSILTFSKEGVKVNITELDLSALPRSNAGADVQATAEYKEKLNPYKTGLPEDVSRKWNDRMESVFSLYQKHADKIDRVTVWGLTDADSWLNFWPIRGRTDYPLLIDRQNEVKPFLKKRLSTQEAASAKPVYGQPYEVTLPNQVKLELISIPKGSFEMGSPEEEPGHWSDEWLHTVTFKEEFWMGKYEITQAQWKAVMGSNPSGFKADDHPVENISWSDAREFCKKLTEIERAAGHIGEDYTYELPTEAQWEYACRANTSSAFNNGKTPAENSNSSPELDEVGWYWDNSGRDLKDIYGSRPVGLKKPNNWGLYDMHGNVGEWVLDPYAGYRDNPGPDPRYLGAGSNNVRGGSWADYPWGCRSANRDYYGYYTASSHVGFRIVLTPSFEEK